jgi:hypothetical protein
VPDATDQDSFVEQGIGWLLVNGETRDLKGTLKTAVIALEEAFVDHDGKLFKRLGLFP